MLFSSIVFLFYFFPIVLLLYYLFHFNRTMQNVVLLIASLFFYAWGEPVNVLILLFSIAFNSGMGYLVGEKENRSLRFRKIILIISISVNIGILFVFKYLGFVMSLFPIGKDKLWSVALPIGISFYTFQALSYVIDVYKGIVSPENPFYVGLYISFFPQLIAGPIIQYKSVAEQIRNRRESFGKFASGICRFSIGVIKKVLLANCFASMADNIFSWSQIGSDRYAVPMLLAWLGSISYTLQIYYDFSAYSDMAIGLALCFGFKFSENFNYPYIATSVNDFWKRWHISLTDWFREYVYFPLGGNKVANNDIMVRNLFVVWLLTGIWHGANWTFILWGLFYFVIQLAEKFFSYPKRMSRPVGHIYTLFIVNLCWVLFRADDLYQAGRFIMNMFGLNGNGFINELFILLIRENWVYLLAGFLFATPVVKHMNKYMYDNPKNHLTRILAVSYPGILLFLMVLSVSYLMSGSYNPFIYFNF